MEFCFHRQLHMCRVKKPLAQLIHGWLALSARGAGGGSSISP
jgi:hypothetical protein